MAKLYTKRNTMSAEVVQFLTARVIQQFKIEYEAKLAEECPKNISDSAMYGIGNYSGEENTIRDYVCKAPQVIKVVENYLDSLGRAKKKKKQTEDFIEGNYLWKKNAEAHQKPTEPIPFSDFYRDVFLAYIQLPLNDLEKAHKASYSFMVGYYMSFPEFQIKTLLFKISLSTDNKEQHNLTIEGVHHKIGSVKTGSYTGKIWMEDGGYLYGYAKEQKNNRKRVSIMGSVDHQNALLDNKIIRAMLQGTTFDDDRVFSWEVVLKKVNHQDVLTNTYSDHMGNGVINPLIIGQEDLKLVSLYLTCHRNVSTFKTERLPSLTKMTTKNVNIGNLINLIGEYVLWNFDFDFNHVTQSKLVILQGSIGKITTIIPPKDYSVQNNNWRTGADLTQQEYNALINISRSGQNQRANKIVIFAFNGIDMVNTAMFDLPMDGIINAATLIDGAFCSLDDPQHGNISGYFVMQKDEKNSVVTRVAYDDLLEFAQKENRLELLEFLLKKTIANYKILEVTRKNRFLSTLEIIDHHVKLKNVSKIGADWQE